VGPVGIAWIVGLLLAGLGAFLLWRGLKVLARRKRVIDTKTTPASQARVGYVEIRGTVEVGASGTTTSPFHQAVCVYCRWRVEEQITTTHYSSGKRRTSTKWVVRAAGMEGGDFYVRDATGRVRIPFSGSLAPTLFLAQRNVNASGMFRGAPEHVEAFLKTRGLSSQGWVFNKAMRYIEETIAPGEPLYALGRVARTGDEVSFVPSTASEMILANLTEAELIGRLGRNGFPMVAFGGLFIAVGLGLGIAASAGAFRAFGG